MNSAVAIAYLKENDQSVFRDVYVEYHQWVYAYVLQKTNSPFMAEEVLQLTFLKFWIYRHRLDENIPLVTQLFRIVRTTMIDQVRKEQVHQHSLSHFAELPSLVSQAQNDAVKKLDETELQSALAAVLNRMPMMQKKVFEMNRFHGMTYREIAQSLSISVKTVETHISRALKFLRENMGILALFLLLKNIF